MTDYHVHTTFSPDAESTVEQYLSRAELIGCSEICFTDHLDVGYYQPQFENKDGAVAAVKYINRIKYDGNVKVLCGIEAGFIPETAHQTADIIKDMPLDYVINSVHQVGGIDPYFPEYFEHKTRKQAYEEYLKAVLASLDAPYDYSVVGHIGYVFRSAPYESPIAQWSEFPDLYDAILIKIIYLGKGIEVNTSSFRYCDSTMPCMSVLRRYAELGGEIITLGSDAHAVRRLCDKFDKAKELLLSSGMRYLAKYQNMKPELYYIK